MQTTNDFTELARPHEKYLFGHAYSLTRDSHRAEDLVQETLLRGWTRFHQFEPGTNLKAWLARILTNLFINECRRGGRRIKAGSLEFSGEPEARPGQPAPAHLEELSPAELIGERAFVETLDETMLRGLTAISSEHLEILLMRAINGLSYEDISRKLRVPLGTTMSRLHRARTAIRMALVEYA